MRHYLMPTRMVLTDKCVENLEPSYIAGGTVKWRGCYGEQFSHFSKRQYGFTVRSSNYIPKDMSKRPENRGPHKNSYTNVRCDMLHNSQKVKTTQECIGWWMDKQYGVYLSNRLLFGHRRNNVQIVWSHFHTMSTQLSKSVEERSAYVQTDPYVDWQLPPKTTGQRHFPSPWEWGTA